MLMRIFILLLLTVGWLQLAAQHYEGKKLRSFLERGEFEVHTRSFSMSTINNGELPDFSTLGVGTGLGYHTPSFHKFSVSMSGFFIWRLYEYNLTNPAEGESRYEIALFDMEDPENNKDMDRLEELNIRYKNRSVEVVAGRQKVNSPLLNEQDNRMRPNLFSGIMTAIRLNSFLVKGGWLTGVSPRGTVNWYSVEGSPGVYSSGRDIYGRISDFKDNISSKGIGVLAVQHLKSGSSSQVWNYYAENLFNLSFAQTDYLLKMGRDTLLLGAQGFYQVPLNDGGNPDPGKAYIQPEEGTFGIGLRTGIRKNSHQLTLNYLAISNNGRFLFPREWGREQFYASLSRERFEGNGGVSAYTIKYDCINPGKKASVTAGIGKTDMPGVQNYVLNKYGVPSYYHFMGSAGYKPQGVLEGMNVKLQVVHKLAQEQGDLASSNLLNKVNMWNFSLIVDYNF